MNVVIGGARRLPQGTALRALTLFLGELAENETEHRVLLRRGLNTPPGDFEQDTAQLCRMMSLPITWCAPAPSDIHPGRESVFVRDYDMIDEADLVLVFIAVGDDLPYSGTAHLMEKAIEVGRPVYAYSVSDEGEIERYGEYDPDERYAAIVPSHG